MCHTTGCTPLFVRSKASILLTITSLACSASATSPSDPSGPAASPSTNSVAIAGTYDAVSVNGANLPILLPTVRGCAMTGDGGRVVLNASGRFTATYQYRRQCRQFPLETITRAIAGRYTVSGSTIMFAADSGFSKFATAPVVGGTINGAMITAQASPAAGITVSMLLRRR